MRMDDGKGREYAYFLADEKPTLGTFRGKNAGSCLSEITKTAEKCLF